MKYEAVVAILDGMPDSAGDILTNNVKLPVQAIPVMNEFQGASLGTAFVTLDGDRLIAEIEFYPSPAPIPPEYYEAYKGVIGGQIVKKNGAVIEEWKLENIGITFNPADKRLPNLKRKP